MVRVVLKGGVIVVDRRSLGGSLTSTGWRRGGWVHARGGNGGSMHGSMGQKLPLPVAFCIDSLEPD
jgi:hypothetical protein